MYFNHRISFDTKGPISPSSEGNSYIMVIVDAFTHYVALNPVPHCNAYYAYTTLKPRKPIMFTANSHKNAQSYCQPNKDSICYNLPLHTHDEDHFHHPQILKLASGTHTEWILNRDKKHNEIYQKVTKKLLQRQNINEQINSRFTPAPDLKIGTFVLIPNFNTQKGISKKLQPLRKGPYQIIAKPTDVTYKITDSDQ